MYAIYHFDPFATLTHMQVHIIKYRTIIQPPGWYSAIDGTRVKR